MPDQVFLDENDPGSGTYNSLIAQTIPSDKPSGPGPVPTDSRPNDAEELTMADSIPPSAPEDSATFVRDSLRPAPLPIFPSYNLLAQNPAPDTGRDSTSGSSDIEVTRAELEPDELDAIESLGPFDDQVLGGLDDEPPPPSEPIVVSEERLSQPEGFIMSEEAQKAIEQYTREETLNEIKKFGITLQQGEFLPLTTLLNIKTILLEQIWLADTILLREAIMIILNSIDPNFGVKIRGKTNDMALLIGIFLERLEIRGLHAVANRLRSRLPKPGSMPPPPLPKT